MNEQSRIRAALTRLIEVLTDIAQTADAKNQQRCPYKSADSRCTFQGGCQNQHHEPEALHCAGDHLLEHAPAACETTEK
jgi:hypothetical protein